MQCLDESANVLLLPHRQSSSQVIDGISDNSRTTAIWSGEDVTLSGDNHNRHADYREFLFEVSPCEADPSTGKTCVDDPVAEIAKMQLFVLYNTENFDKRDSSTDPIRRESLVDFFNINPEKRYELDARIR